MGYLLVGNTCITACNLRRGRPGADAARRDVDDSEERGCVVRVVQRPQVRQYVQDLPAEGSAPKVLFSASVEF